MLVCRVNLCVVKACGVARTVGYAQANGRVDVQLLEAGGVGPQDFPGLGARTELTADRVGAESRWRILGGLRRW